jgi:hypothetical protein
MRLALLTLGALSLAASPPAAAAQLRPEVGFAGLVSPDLSAADLAQAEAAVERLLERRTRIRGKSSMLAAVNDTESVAAALNAARRAADAGGQALDAFNLPKALEELGRALELYDAAFGDRLVPGEVARVLERRAQAAYALRRPTEMRRDFARLVLLQPGKGLDERVFAPDAVAAYAEEAARVRAAPPAPTSIDELTAMARHSGVRYTLAGEVRRSEGFVDFSLALVSAGGTLWTRDIRAPREAISDGLERGLGPMLEAAGVARREVVPIPTPTPIAAATKPPRERDRDRPKPVYRRWYFWGGVVLAGAAAAYATSDRDGGGGGKDPDPQPTPDTSITISFEDP